MILLFAIRKHATLFGQPLWPMGMTLLIVFILLYVTAPRLHRRYVWYPWLYFFLQSVLLVLFAWLPPLEDVWAVLVLPLSYQLVNYTARRTTAIWATVLTLTLILTLMRIGDWLPGLGFALYLLAITIFYLSYDAVYVATERGRAESQRLLTELRRAHQQLEAYTAQAEALAAEQERNRLVREIHDSVGQLIFSIRLHTEAASLLLQQEPGRVPEQLDRLYELSAAALAELRTLIGHWRPS